MDRDTLKHLEWYTDGEDRIPNWATSNFLRVPSAIMYMSKEKIASWKVLNDFGKMVLNCTLQYIDSLREPVSFCTLVEKQNSPNFDPTTAKEETPPEMLAFNVYMCRTMSTKLVIELKYDCKCFIHLGLPLNLICLLFSG
jgi:hypothetical protein